MQQGADTSLLEKWLANPLTSAQRHALAAALESAEELPVQEATVLVAALRQGVYVEGVSVVAHRMMDLTGCDACFLLVEMEHRVFVTGRSRGGRPRRRAGAGRSGRRRASGGGLRRGQGSDTG